MLSHQVDEMKQKCDKLTAENEKLTEKLSRATNNKSDGSGIEEFQGLDTPTKGGTANSAVQRESTTISISWI